MSIPPNTIIVFEEGGIVQWVAADRSQKVIVISYDPKNDDPEEVWNIWPDVAQPFELETEIQMELDKFMEKNPQ